MEYLQFGFAAAFCIILYRDQRNILKALTKSNERVADKISQIMQFICEKKAD